MSGDVSVRELRNYTAEVLRRVEAGERIRVTVDRRPVAATESMHARRLRTLQAVQSTYAALDVDEAVAASFAELVAVARRAGRRPKVQDTWIAATAHAHQVAVNSQDADFDDLAIEVVRV